MLDLNEMLFEMWFDRDRLKKNFIYEHAGLYIKMDISIDSDKNAFVKIKDVECEFLPNCVSYLKKRFEEDNNIIELTPIETYLWTT